MLTEGEFDALAARRCGVPAWTHTGGAGSSLRPEWEQYFANGWAAVVYDCDDAGRNGAQRTAKQLLAWGCRVRVVDLELENGEDVTDWFVKYRRTGDDLFEHIRKFPIRTADTA